MMAIMLSHVVVVAEVAHTIIFVYNVFVGIIHTIIDGKIIVIYHLSQIEWIGECDLSYYQS